MAFKFRKYKDGYEGEKRGSTPRYPLTIEAFLESQGLERPMEPDASVVAAGASLSAPSSDAALVTAGVPSDASPAGTSTHGASEDADLLTPSSEASQQSK